MGFLGAGLGSSGIGASLNDIVSISLRHLIGLGLHLLAFSPAVNLAAQAPDAHHPSPTAALPRFTLREIVAGTNDSVSRIPGPWLGAALAVRPESLARAHYHQAARLSGIVPLGPKALVSDRSHHIMGLYRRQELTAAARRTLTAIRQTIPLDSTRSRFDFLFRPRGEWVVDLHDAALAWSRHRAPGLTWGAAHRALADVRWVDAKDSLLEEAVPRALYGLTVLAATDSAAFAELSANLQRSDSASASAAQLLLRGYAESRQWYTDALEFFLTQPWIASGARGRSVADYVGEEWRALGYSGAAAGPQLPEIRTRVFGYPQAVPRYGIPPSLFQRLVVPHNLSARSWLEQHGQAGMLRALQWLPPGDTSLVLLQAGAESIRLTTLPRQSRESLNGFLEPNDVIVIDPGYSPLLALGTVVHEWQHLLFRRQQLENFARSLESGRQTVIELPGIEPYLAEGFAEWSSDRILRPLQARWPLLALGELEKRAALANQSWEDQHLIGHALVLALASATRNPAATTRLLLQHAEHPSEIAKQPALLRAWRRHARVPDRVLPGSRVKFLMPEVTFTVEDGFPDVITSRIIVPSNRKVGR
jgi:hypothetical protein